MFQATPSAKHCLDWPTRRDAWKNVQQHTMIRPKAYFLVDRSWPWKATLILSRVFKEDPHTDLSQENKTVEVPWRAVRFDWSAARATHGATPVNPPKRFPLILGNPFVVWGQVLRGYSIYEPLRRAPYRPLWCLHLPCIPLQRREPGLLAEVQFKTFSDRFLHGIAEIGRGV